MLLVGLCNLQIADLSAVNSKPSEGANLTTPLKYPQNLKQVGLLHKSQLLFYLDNLSITTDQSTVQMFQAPVEAFTEFPGIEKSSLLSHTVMCVPFTGPIYLV